MEQTKENTGTFESKGRMPEPPNAITTKDLMYLKDAMSWELLAFKKCSQAASSCQDPEIQTQLNQAGQMHQRQYHQLLQYLESNPNQQYLQ